MGHRLSRREVLAIPVAGAAAALVGGRAAAQPEAAMPESAPPDALWPEFPKLPAALAREVVGAAHRDEAKVRELVEANPNLVNTWWDWGFGDWESPLGAAAHTGRRAIAEFLIERGARVDVFAAAMLGWAEVLRAMVAARPGIQRTLGPHGITLLAHARAGGPEASEALAYLESLGDADIGPEVKPIDEKDLERFVGRYGAASGAEGIFDVTVEKGRAMFVRGAASSRLHYAGENAFFPAGAPGTRLKFAVEGERAASVTITGGVAFVEAVRLTW